MAKKPQNPLKNGNLENVSKTSERSNPSKVFKTLFGEISEQSPASNSLFSDNNNPFRRKLVETRQPNPNLGLGLAEKDAERESNLGNSNSSVIQQQRKRKKDEVKKESSDLDNKSVEEKSKMLKTAELKGNEKSGNSNLGFVSKEAREKDTHFPGNGESGDFIAKKEKKKGKRKRDELETEYEARRYGVTNEMKQNNGERSVLGEKRKKMDNPEDMMVSKEGFEDESKLLRTIFVGNLPLKLKKKDIVKEFAKFGEVESVRIRSVPIIAGKMPRKGAVIKKRINENGDSVHAYVVFKTEESAQASLAHNMAVVGGNHIRVDRACPPHKKLKGGNSLLYDNKRTIFVGNLPFDVKDEELYHLFSSIKNLESGVEAIRVIRDPGSSLGKGIAYVLFKTTDAANMIVKKHNLKIRDRELRVSHVKSNNTSLKRINSSQPLSNSNSAKKAVVSRTPDSGSEEKTNFSYQGLQASKSGGQRKVRTQTKTSPPKSKSHSAREPKSGKKKRPAVAARKEKARQAANASKVVGAKRKLGNQTPESAGQKKKARKFG